MNREVKWNAIATNFFGQSDFFPYSEDKIKKMFESWGAMLSSSNNAIMLNKLLEFSPDILLGLLLQTLHKFACNCNYQTMLVSLRTLYGQSVAKQLHIWLFRALNFIHLCNNTAAILSKTNRAQHFIKISDQTQPLIT